MRIPRATYRLQVHAAFGLPAAADLVDYLDALGVSDVYASPLLTARKGSLHGYDVTNLAHVNAALGGEAALMALSHRLRERGMGLLLDIVPNHMAADSENPWWWSVLCYGPASPYARFFDIRWHTPPGPDPDDFRLLLPVLGDPFGAVLERSELSLAWEEEGLVVAYFDRRFPLAPGTYGVALGFGLESLQGRDDPGAQAALGELLEHARRCPRVPLDAPAPEEARHGFVTAGETLRRALAAFRAAHPATARRVAANLSRFCGDPADPASLGRLEALLGKQMYRLADWRLAASLGNYRRFFDINELAGLRVEDAEVFDAAHAKVLALAEAGAVTGLRVDHVDGLYDPQAYLERLARRLREQTQGDFYVVVEKLLGPGERIPEAWPVAGTTGYDFLSSVNAVFVDPRGVAYLDRSYADFTQGSEHFGEVVRQGKDLVIHELFEGELSRLARAIGVLAARDRHACDVRARELREALAQVTACMRVYRTYTRSAYVRPVDRAYVEEAVAEARRRTADILAGPAAFAFVRRVLLLEGMPARPEERASWVAFVRDWQQFSGPAMAKGLEDTAFFRHTRLISLNAVGGTAEQIENPPDVQAFHAENAERLGMRAGSLTTTSTHDTKRSGDVGCRIDVVSELPFAWARAFRRWRRLNEPHKLTLGERTAPDAHEEILLYQTLIGAWPWSHAERAPFAARLRDFMRKALREAKVNSSWLRPDTAYEEAVLAFVAAILDPERSAAFLADFTAFESRIAFFGAWNALSQVVLKIASPGVPDFYQGDELWDFSLTDPDNRRPVDFGLRRRLLAELGTPGPLGPDELGALLADWHSGRIKMYVVRQALAARRAHAQVFASGDYIPLAAAGSRAKNVVAFARRLGGRWIMACVPRLTTQLSRTGRFPLGRRAWGGTMLRLPPGAPRRWTDVFTGVTIEAAAVLVHGGELFPLRSLLGTFPVALLAGEA